MIKSSYRKLHNSSLCSLGLRAALILTSALSCTAFANSPSQVDLATAKKPQVRNQVSNPVGVKAPTVALPARLARRFKHTSLKIHAHAARRTHSIAPRDQVGAANDAARIQPESSGFSNAIQRYAYADGALYQIYARPGQVSDIALQEGEQLVGAGPVAAGDTVRWIIGDTISGSGTNVRVHILVKPTRADLMTNLIINTNRRTYHLELRANPSTYMASISWIYPQDALIALRSANAAAAIVAPVASGIDVSALNFAYRLAGDNPPWRPLRIFDDGKQVFIEFAPSIAQGEMPPLFVIGAGGEAELVNYRVSGRHMIVDRLFDVAEMRLGDKRSVQKVKIMRSPAKVVR
ncbi:MAG: P-type conjugative transfer protein TrbG [Pseudomonadota bacterium]